MLSILEFLISPVGIFILLGVLFVLPMLLICLKSKRSFQKLQKHYNGVYSCFNSGLTFEKRGFHFNYKIEGSGGINYGFRTQTSVLWAEVRSPVNFFCGNAEVTKFQFAWNLGSKVHRKNISTGGVDLLIGADNEEFLQRLATVINENIEMGPMLAKFFAGKSSCVRVMEETHIGGRKLIMRYYGLPQVYVEPAVLDEAIDTLIALIEKIDVVPA